MLKPLFQPRNSTITLVLEHLRTPLYRNGYALLFSGVASSALGMVYWVIATQYYDAATVGLNSAAIAALMLVSGIAQLSLNSILVRFIPSAGQATARLIKSAYGITVGTSLIGGLVFGLGVDFWAPALRPFLATPTRLFCFVGSIAVWSIFALQDSVLTGLRQTLWVPLENIAVAVLKLGLLILLAPLWHGYGIFAAWMIPALLALTPINLLIFRHALPHHEQRTAPTNSRLDLGAMTRFALANFIGSLCSLAYTTLLPLVVVNLAGPQANAYFYMPWMVATGLQMIALHMMTALTVEASRDPQRLSSYCRRAVRQSIYLLAPLVLLIVVAAPWILSFFGEDYTRQGTMLLRLLALATLPNVFVMLYISLMRVQNSPGGVIFAQGTLGGLLLGISVFLLPLYGITGVGWAALISQSAVALFVIGTQVQVFRGADFDSADRVIK